MHLDDEAHLGTALVLAAKSYREGLPGRRHPGRQRHRQVSG